MSEPESLLAAYAARVRMPQVEADYLLGLLRQARGAPSGLERDEVYDLIDAERDYQKAKWGDRKHSVQAWILILQAELAEAAQAWVRTGEDAGALDELRQVAACAVAALEQHGGQVKAREWHG